LELDVEVQDQLKPTFSLTNVNKISEDSSSVFFNQNTASFHNNDQTLNLGVGYRQLINEDKILLGVNIFLDYSFDDAHQRNGIGLEAISSIFDIRGNYYDATSGIQDISAGISEEAMDGFDVRLDYHLPFNNNTRVFTSLFDFENGAGSFGVKGEKYGLSILTSNLDLEIGYVDDNRTGDGRFANVSYTVPLGIKDIQSKKSDDLFEYVSVRHRLYEPVKRENKIKVVSTKLNIKASGF
jgi:adhesin/invasin